MVASLQVSKPSRDLTPSQLTHTYQISATCSGLFESLWRDEQIFVRCVPGAVRVPRPSPHCSQMGRHLPYLTQDDWLPRQLSDKESACQGRRPRFDPCVQKIPWRRKWQPAPAFLPGKSQGQGSLEGYSPWSCRVQHNLAIEHEHAT